MWGAMVTGRPPPLVGSGAARRLGLADLALLGENAGARLLHLQPLVGGDHQHLHVRAQHLQRLFVEHQLLLDQAKVCQERG